MTNRRILLEGGHSEITVAGVKYMADEDGCFTVPEDVAITLLKMYPQSPLKDKEGKALEATGKYLPGLEVLQATMEQADAHVGNLKNQLELAQATAKRAHEEFDAFIAKSKRASDANTNRQPQQSHQQQGSRK